MKTQFISLLIALLAGLLPLQAQQVSISGIVTDKKLNEPIIGASVVVKGTSNGCITDLDGNFQLNNVASGSTLVVSYIGYQTQEIPVQKGKTSYQVTLSEDTQTLDEVVVVGFGTQKKVNLTGAVATVDTKALESRPVSQVGQALQGTVPGLNLSTADLGGQLGQSMKVNIRGTGTIGTGSKGEPLILIDGMEGNMNTLNPEDIESISVLKDAASSSIYGSRAAFGVILITTKKGKAGKMTINYNNSFRYSGPTNLPNQLDSYRFANFFNEAAVNQGDKIIFDEETIGRIQDYMAGKITTTTIPNGSNWHFHEKANDNVNWYKTHFTWAWSQEHNLSMSGGTEKLQYYVSGSYLNQNGNLRYGNDNMKRYNLSAKINTKINKYIDFNLSTKFIRYDLDNPIYLEEGGLLYHDIARMWPTMPFKDPNGHYMRNGKLAQLTDGGRSKTHNDDIYLQGQVILHPLKNWNIYAEAGMRVINQNKQVNLNKIYEYDINDNPVELAFSGSYAPGATFARMNYLNSNFYTTSFYTDYTLEKNDHYLKVMLGMNTEEYIVRSLSAQRSDVISGLIPEISYFLNEAKKAAQIVADNYPLYNDYPALFNSNSLSSMPEVLLWRAYDANLTPAVNHFVVGYLQRNGGGNSDYTRSMINTYLMQNGLPIYAAGTDYKGDRTYQDVAEGRDPRLTYNTLMPGDMLTEKAAMTEAIIDGAGYYYRAPITEMAENRSTTGYSIKKGLNTDPSQGPTLPSTTACVIFRAAEAYLNYMEADYELNHSLDAKSKGYWEAIRRRAGMDTDYEKTNRNTDLTKEIDLARYSGNNLVDVTLYNIRRERRVELAAEGFRLRDLRRWCALDKMQNYQVEGFNLWAENYKRYATPDAGINGQNFDKALTVIDLKEAGTEGANVSAKSDGDYLLPYRVISSNIAYNGYNWNPNRYLFPIAFDHFRLTTEVEGSGDYTSSPIYQNPGWKIETNSLPEGE